ncbi:MAG: MerR family transcriptional regulator [Acidobacteriia bacterium]|nr:MerR family transcriptional regulator [Terriglobia bacterium]
MRIGELAKQAGVSVQTVRYYERRHLLPVPRRTAAGYRQYQESDLEIVQTIKRLQRFGFTLRETRRVLELYALPSDGTGRSPYPRGSHECLREVAQLGVQKLTAMNEQIRSLVEIRDELEKALREIQTRMRPSRKRAAPKQALKVKAS